jgi:type IV secretion system protein VirB11
MHDGTRPLMNFLKCFEPFLADSRTREIVVNEPLRFGVLRAGIGWEWFDEPSFTFDRLDAIGILAGYLLNFDFDETIPWCLTKLPGGERYTTIRPPALENSIAVSIRRPSREKHTVWDMDFQKLMETANLPDRRSPNDDKLLELYHARRYPEFFSLAVKSHKQMAATGLPGSGKTFQINCWLQEIPEHERVVTIEGMPEFGDMPPKNRVPLLCGSKAFSFNDAVETTLRLFPDRVAIQELRSGMEVAAFMRLNAHGFRGGFSTWHADSDDPFTPLVLMIQSTDAGRNLDEAKLHAYFRQILDVVVYCKRDPITQEFSTPSIWYRGAET